VIILVKKRESGAQKFYCTLCRKYQQMAYRSRACRKGTRPMISKLICEGVSVRGISRILRVSINTVQKDIRGTAKSIAKPPIRLHQENIEVGELRTFIGNKRNQYWIAYALNRTTQGNNGFYCWPTQQAYPKNACEYTIVVGCRQDQYGSAKYLSVIDSFSNT
jgi:hypothetical protein